MAKKYKVKPTKVQIDIIHKYWKALEQEENKFFDKVMAIEKSMEKDTGIEGIEFFSCDGSYVGVGNSARTMELIQIR